MISSSDEEMIQYLQIHKYKLQKALADKQQQVQSDKQMIQQKIEEKVQSIKQTELNIWKKQNLPQVNTEEGINWKRYRQIIAGEIMRILQKNLLFKLSKQKQTEMEIENLDQQRNQVEVEGEQNEQNEQNQQKEISVKIDEIANDQQLFDTLSIYYQVQEKQQYYAKIVQILEDFQTSSIVSMTKKTTPITYSISVEFFQKLMEVANKIIQQRGSLGCYKNQLRDSLNKSIIIKKFDYFFFSDTYVDYLVSLLQEFRLIDMENDHKFFASTHSKIMNDN